VKLIPVIRGVKEAAELAIVVATIGAEKGNFGSVAMSSPEIRAYEESAFRTGVGSYSII